MAELRNIEVEVSAAPKAPEEVSIDSREMVEEKFAARQHIIRDPVVFKQLLLCEPPYRSLRSWQIAAALRRKYPKKERVDPKSRPQKRSPGVSYVTLGCR